MEFIRLISEIEYRRERLWMRVFLDLCGFCTHEQDVSVSRDDFMIGNQSEELIIFIGNDLPCCLRNRPHTYIILLDNVKGYSVQSTDEIEAESNIVWYATGFYNKLFWDNFLNKAEDSLFTTDQTDNLKAIDILAGCYDEKVMKSIYMLNDLYVSCRMSYNVTAPLEEAVSILQAVLGHESIRKRNIQDQYPRIAFACTFLAVKVNECMLRLNSPLIYKTDSVLDIIKNKLGGYSYLKNALLLLESTILKNERLGSRQLLNQCEQIEKECLPGYKHQGSFLYAESRYDLPGRSSGLRDESMLDSYRRCVEDNPKHYRARYKIALCYEHMGVKEHDVKNIRYAIREYEEISSLVDVILPKWRSAVEWEYGFKAKFRAGLLLRRLNDLHEAEIYLKKCEEEINYFNANGLLFCISVYGGITQEVVQSKYVKTCQIIDNMLKEVKEEQQALG